MEAGGGACRAGRGDLIAVRDVATSPAVEIHVAGKVLVVPPDVDAAALRRLLALLENPA
jgi:hypothetical protein